MKRKAGSKKQKTRRKNRMEGKSRKAEGENKTNPWCSPNKVNRLANRIY